MITLLALESIAAQVIGAQVELSPHKSAADVPGWDSLNNTLIALEISAEYGVELTGADLAKCTTFGILLDVVNKKIG
jgi:acyl carrier protein